MEDDILIEHFLRNTLSKEEHISFVARMESDISFKEQVVLEEQLLAYLGETYWSFATNDSHARVEAYKKILESSQTKELKENITIAITQYKEKQTAIQKSNRRFTLKFITRIAALLVVFCSIVWYFSKDDHIDYASLTENAWRKNVGLDFTLRSNPSDAIKMSLEKALHFYTYKKYDSILIVLEKYNMSTKQYKDVLLMRALARYKLNQTETAFSTLDSLQTYAPDISNWYKGLMYLDQNNHEKASLYIKIPSESDEEIKFKK
ncbi:hypothetical protein [Kordia sp.]|uniref:hypothetical protein n=1 Tax=Kordia sp. TaxID=1965332 RepID=UPI003D27D25A